MPAKKWHVHIEKDREIVQERGEEIEIEKEKETHKETATTSTTLA